MDEWSAKRAVCISERTLAYFNSTPDERYYDAKNRRQHRHLKCFFALMVLQRWGILFFFIHFSPYSYFLSMVYSSQSSLLFLCNVTRLTLKIVDLGSTWFEVPTLQKLARAIRRRRASALALRLAKRKSPKKERSMMETPLIRWNIEALLLLEFAKRWQVN